DGFAVASRAGMRAAQIIFITAHEEHAARAFDIEACDYLLKPFTAARFRDAVARARARLGRRSIDAARTSYVRRFTVKDGERFLLLRTDEIDVIEAYGNYVRLHVGSAVYLFHSTMTELERSLDPGE